MATILSAGQRLHAASTILLMSLTLIAGGPREDVVTARRGVFAFHYSPYLTDEQLAWYSRFDLLVTHDPLPRAQASRLRAAGTKLLVYEWSVAFYETRARPWESAVLGNSDALLNAQPLTGGVGSATAPAWYFDPASEWHERARAAELARYVRTIGYDGVFFDTTTVESVHPAARADYERRHSTPYDVAFARFLARLRKEMPDGLIFTNQGYRSAANYLPYADWDLTESLITRPVAGQYALRPWNDSRDPWNSIRFLMRNLIAPVAKEYPHVRFAHLNYITGNDETSRRMVSAIARIFDAQGYAAGETTADEIDAAYFFDAGSPAGAAVDHADGEGSHRFFENGLIAVRFGAGEAVIDVPDSSGFLDVRTGQQHCGPAITLPALESPRAYFFERTATCHRSE